MISSVARGAAAIPSANQASRPGWFSRAVQAVVRARRVGRCRSALSALSDDTLKDIGVSRSEIDYLAQVMADRGDDPIRLPPNMWIRG